jgi:ribosomal protein L37AE/L43A
MANNAISFFDHISPFATRVDTVIYARIKTALLEFPKSCDACPFIAVLPIKDSHDAIGVENTDNKCCYLTQNIVADGKKRTHGCPLKYGTRDSLGWRKQLNRLTKEQAQEVLTDIQQLANEFNETEIGQSYVCAVCGNETVKQVAREMPVCSAPCSRKYEIIKKTLKEKAREI